MKSHRNKIAVIAVDLAAVTISCLIIFNGRAGVAKGADDTDKSTVSFNQEVIGKISADINETAKANDESQVIAETSGTSTAEALEDAGVKQSQPPAVKVSSSAKVSAPVKKAEPVKPARSSSSPKPVVKTASAPAVTSSRGMDVVNTAKKYIGIPYVYGAAGPGSFDCSGFTMYVYAKFGVNLPHNSLAQSQIGQYVPKAQLQPGDLVFFATDGTGKVSHVGIYVGGGNFIQAPRTGDTVKISSMTNPYYQSKYVTARRVIH
jgi:cell wall-associated NlpC family hydrolase